MNDVVRRALIEAHRRIALDRSKGQAILDDSAAAADRARAVVDQCSSELDILAAAILAGGPMPVWGGKIGKPYTYSMCLADYVDIEGASESKPAA